MMILAVLNVDKEKLTETGHSFEDEMGWLAQSGITLSSYTEAGAYITYEYAAFVLNTDTKEYTQIGRPVMTEQLCRNRFQELTDGDAPDPCYDTACVVIKRRLVSEFNGEWDNL
ncbi:MAG: hypothetical protein K1W41_24690 [Lachnospiraceae bacterium]